MHPYFLDSIYKAHLAELERRAELTRIVLESSAARDRRPSRIVEAVRALRLREREGRTALRADLHGCC